MEAFIIEPTQDTPAINFNHESGELSITERSYPEDAFEFYIPVLRWLEDYIKTPASKTTFLFCLDYFNTQSSKQLFKVMLLLEELAKTSPVKIKWKYKSNDKEMHTHGEIFSKIVTVPFEVEEA